MNTNPFAAPTVESSAQSAQAVVENAGAESWYNGVGVTVAGAVSACALCMIASQETDKNTSNIIALAVVGAVYWLFQYNHQLGVHQLKLADSAQDVDHT